MTESAKAAASTPAAPQDETDMLGIIEALLEMWDERTKPEEYRTYVPGSLALQFEHVREMHSILSATAIPPKSSEEPKKLWLWRNFVDGRPEYWAFDNAYPTDVDCGDPQTLGEPCGYAIFKPSRQGRTDRTEAQVLAAIKHAPSEIAAPDPRIASLSAEVAALRKDAERYRWLRAGGYPMKVAQSILNDTPFGIDEHVDAARFDGERGA